MNDETSEDGGPEGERTIKVKAPTGVVYNVLATSVDHAIELVARSHHHYDRNKLFPIGEDIDCSHCNDNPANAFDSNGDATCAVCSASRTSHSATAPTGVKS